MAVRADDLVRGHNSGRTMEAYVIKPLFFSRTEVSSSLARLLAPRFGRLSARYGLR